MTTASQILPYRPEIDGLRALAVLSVVLYHFFPDLLPGGFRGVDIFFVISGYLISSQIIKHHEQKRFSFWDFYKRRIKRILPASLVMMMVASVFAKFIFLSVDLGRFISSAFAAFFFWANFYFWRDGGYFGTSDKLKPLLHTWSLSVEEQFYFFFPILFFAALLLFKRNRQIVIWLVVLAAILSLGLLIFLSLIGGENPAFFLLPTRIWQFATGVFFALLAARASTMISSVPLSLALLLLLLGLGNFFPSLPSALMVTFGSGLFIYFMGEKTLFYTAFTNRIATFIGRISFSLYLYHWPAIVFLGYVSITEPAFTSKTAVLLGVFIVSALSYKFIELTFRHRLALGWTLGLVAICAVFLTVIWDNTNKQTPEKALPELFAEAAGSHYRCPLQDYIAYGASRACLMGQDGKQREFVMLGNSHAQMFVPLFNQYLLENEKGGMLLPLNGCLPTTRINLDERCAQLANINLNELLRDTETKTVVIGMTWYADSYWTADGIIDQNISEALTEGVMDLITRLQKQDKTVFLLGPIQIPGTDLASILPRQLKFGFLQDAQIAPLLRRERKIYETQFSALNAAMQEVLGSRYLEPSQFLCDGDYCYFGNQTQLFFADDSHLGQAVMGRLLPLLAQFKEAR